MFKSLKLVLTAGRFVYELVDELRIEAKVNREIEAQQRRIQAERYREASHTAGHEVIVKKSPGKETS